MSFLAPLYLLGALAVAAPVLWHLIRRRPKSPVRFSSLMFLRSAPPRITRRSRLENLPLLLLRVLAILLLALAFARPLFRGAAETTEMSQGKRVVVLVDASASMRRAGLWDAAQSRVREVLRDLGPEDIASVVVYDAKPRVLWGFDESMRTAVQDRPAQMEAAVQSVTPGWFGSDLGTALSFAADYAQQVDDRSAGRETSEGADADIPTSGNRPQPLPAQIHLVSDMQAGSDISALQSFTWPDQTHLEVHSVASPLPTNASLRVIEEEASAEPSEAGLRVRVANSLGGTESAFRLAWQPADAATGDAGLPIQVPPGESRVVRVPLPRESARSLTLSGDDHDFDNRWFLVPPETSQSTVLFLGGEATSRRESLLYYLQQVPLDQRFHRVVLERRDSASLLTPIDPANIPLVVIGDPVPRQSLGLLGDYLARGGRVLWVLEDAAALSEDAAALEELSMADALHIGEANVSDHALFQRIDFTHELFIPLADPRFNDFSKIRTWSHRSVSGYPESWKEVMTFDDGDPALLEVAIQEGRLWMLTTGWQPQSSQLALSTKFAPLVLGMVRSRDQEQFRLAAYFVGDSVPEAWFSTDETIDAEWSSDDRRFAKPGVWDHPDGGASIAVNIPPSESDTAPMPVEHLERFGVSVGATQSPEVAAVRRQRIQDAELERQQSLWQWGLLGVLGLIGLESLLAGWKSRWRSPSS